MENLAIEAADFTEALGKVQPSARREGFTTIPELGILKNWVGWNFQNNQLDSSRFCRLLCGLKPIENYWKLQSQDLWEAKDVKWEDVGALKEAWKVGKVGPSFGWFHLPSQCQVQADMDAAVCEPIRKAELFRELGPILRSDGCCLKASAVLLWCWFQHVCSPWVWRRNTQIIYIYNVFNVLRQPVQRNRGS